MRIARFTERDVFAYFDSYFLLKFSNLYLSSALFTSSWGGTR